MRQKYFTRSRVDLDTLAAGEGLFTCAMVDPGDILVPPLLGCNAGEALGELVAHDFMRSFPNYER